MIEKPIFWEYLIFDEEEGLVIGIKDNAPEEAKKAYEEYNKLKKTGIKL